MINNHFKPKGREQSNIPVFEYGNGVQLEQKVWAKAQEIKIGDENLDVVKVHFLPKNSEGQIIAKPDQVLQEDKNKIRADALKGFIELAKCISEKAVNIKNHNLDEDFYLCATTNSSFAHFLVTKCGFRGDFDDGLVYVNASEFCNAANIESMRIELELVSEIF